MSCLVSPVWSVCNASQCLLQNIMNSAAPAFDEDGSAFQVSPGKKENAICGDWCVHPKSLASRVWWNGSRDHGDAHFCNLIGCSQELKVKSYRLIIRIQVSTSQPHRWEASESTQNCVAWNPIWKCMVPGPSHTHTMECCTCMHMSKRSRPTWIPTEPNVHELHSIFSLFIRALQIGIAWKHETPKCRAFLCVQRLEKRATVASDGF